eukprot:CAMPEP_0206511372 /NCGR_PEP_ID=MMETSP0324_2-20121206/60252_1 /ASSEMBLY_ACC=CAM_ASM_000836 /TAXON_ID=2866 /ORGANISM="Crypthecodinium cohnii, Strain Seligo" /LENGTH=38 /DNA_ID= /DNA_START= /DNA_END= /DNA_ORIENTATION=
MADPIDGHDDRSSDEGWQHFVEKCFEERMELHFQLRPG